MCYRDGAGAGEMERRPQWAAETDHHHASGTLHPHHGVSLTAKERPVGSSAPLPKRENAGERGAKGGGKGATPPP